MIADHDRGDENDGSTNWCTFGYVIGDAYQDDPY